MSRIAGNSEIWAREYGKPKGRKGEAQREKESSRLLRSWEQSSPGLVGRGGVGEGNLWAWPVHC